MADPCLPLPCLLAGAPEQQRLPPEKEPKGEGGKRNKRQAWLEGELQRLIQDVRRLADENEDLTRELGRDPSEAGSPRCLPPPGPPPPARWGPPAPSTVGRALDPEQIELEQGGSGGNPEALQAWQRRCSVSLAAGAGLVDDEMDRGGEGRRPRPPALPSTPSGLVAILAGKANTVVVRGSALGLGRPVQAGIYVLAFAGVVFVLLATAFTKGGGVQEAPALELHGDHHHAAAAHHHRRLFAAAESSPLMKNIAVSLTGCGLIALIVNVLKQPLILGYLLGGVLVGPIGLGIVESHHDISQLSSLGLIFLLFMIGLELDVIALLRMGKVVLLTGFLQFPICAGVMAGIFMGLESVGFSFGKGMYAAMYCGMTCGISSTMVVVKMLGEKGEMDSQPGRLTVGILIFQDIWAIVVLAIQPNLASPEILGILKTFGMIGVLVVIAMAYAKFIMPVVLYQTSTNLELMLVISIAWCFFIGCTAILPFVGLSMELASLIAGVALATFPYSAEFNGKIKYIRDFFITLFFAGLGMQIPVPSLGAIAMGALIALVVIVVRWLGIFVLVWALGGGTRLAAISTINLSQVSEFALVICSLGMGFGHIDGETMTIIIWTFSILAIAASYMIGYNAAIYDAGARLINRLRGKAAEEAAHGAGHHDDGHEVRDIVILGFHKVAFMLVAEIKAKNPQLLKKIHIIDFNQAIMPRLREVGLKCTYGDISSPDVLEHAHHGEPRIVIATIPDSQLRGITNKALVKVSKQVWPSAHVIVTADNPEQARTLYKAGADYVLRMAKLCAERLHELLSQNRQQVFGGGELADIFEHFKRRDRELRGAHSFIWK